MTETPKRRKSRLSRRIRRLRRGARNALELLREGRISAPYRAPYEVVEETTTYALRRYGEDVDTDRGPVLLVPPLMVTSEIYDIAPELSATTILSADGGLDVWLCDFGSPEDVDGGLERTLDDHILAISACVDRIHTETGRDVHLIGYSQGGMFCYQAAAYRRSANVASVLTFGAPVDLRRNLPVRVHESITEKVMDTASAVIKRPLSQMKGISGRFSSRGFKLLSPRKELQHFVQTLGLLHDRDALAAREPKRRFLGGEGFIAWPGPAFRKFVDEFVVNNRMKDGGFVIGGRTVTLAEIRAPICYAIGLRDDMARPEAVRAIEKAAVNADLYPLELDAGHFGMVVGSTAVAESWPFALEWLAWIDGVGDKPARLDPDDGPRDGDLPSAADPQAGGVRMLYDLAADAVDGVWNRLGEIGAEATAMIDAVRWQLPRIARMASLTHRSKVSYARVLADQAEAIGDQPFFLWRGRAFTYAEADKRVTDVAGVLWAQGVRRGHHVGILMHNSPDYLTLVGAINRVGAVSVLLPSDSRGLSLEHALSAGEVDHLVADPGHVEAAQAAFGAGLMTLGRADVAAPAGVVDLDALLEAPPALPDDVAVNPGRADDLATLIFTSGTTGLPKAARITNGRWIAAGLGAATACELTPRDTVYCCLPLYHSTGMLVAVGGALIGGTRLALAPRFSATRFWPEVRRTGASVVFYVGELLRYLVSQPPHPLDASHPVRLFAGNGLAPDVWREVQRRFGDVRILEFYSATEANVVLLNRSGEKVGSVGTEFTGRVDIALVRYDVVNGAFERDDDGHLVEVEDGEPGVLISRVTEGGHPLGRFSGYTDAEATEQKVLRDVFEPGDAWFDSGDLLYRDADGDHFFVDRLGDTFRWKGENVSTALVAQVLRGVEGVTTAAVYGIALEGHEGRAGMAALELAEGAELDPAAAYAHVTEHLTPAARPRFLRIVDHLDVTDTLKVVKYHLQAEGADPGRIADPIYLYDEAAGTYVRLDLARYAALLHG